PRKLWSIFRTPLLKVRETEFRCEAKRHAAFGLLQLCLDVRRLFRVMCPCSFAVCGKFLRVDAAEILWRQRGEHFAPDIGILALLGVECCRIGLLMVAA